MLIPLLLTALAVGQTPSPAAPEPDSVVNTAPATTVMLDGAEPPAAPAIGLSAASTTPHRLSTDEQISQWLTDRSTSPAPYGSSPIWRDDRAPHGQLSVSLGTGGYRDYEAAMSLPVGQSGRLDIRVRQIEGGYPYGYGLVQDPYFSDGGYVVPGRAAPRTAPSYERHQSPAGSSPDLRGPAYDRDGAPE